MNAEEYEKYILNVATIDIGRPLKNKIAIQFSSLAGNPKLSLGICCLDLY